MGDTNNIDSSVIQRTQDSLGKYIKKPPLSEKLLRKPPFRFLHDIVNVLIKDHGYLKGLYSTDELISDNIKDRDAKIKFLQSLIDVVKISTEENITARPSKIVAGQEPEKTNELLQAIARAIEKKIDASQAIEEVKNGKTVVKTKSKVAGKNEKTTQKLVEKTDKVVVNKEKEKEKRKIIENGAVVKKSKENEKSVKPKDKIVKEKDKPVSKPKEKTLVKGAPKALATTTEKKPSDNNISKRQTDKIKRSSSNEDSISTRSDLDKRIPPQPPPPSAKERTINNVLGAIVENVEQIVPREKTPPKPRLPDKIELVVPEQQHEPVPKPREKTPPTTIKPVEAVSSQKPSEPTFPKLHRNSTEELSAIIDEEAERRRAEKQEKRAARSTKSRRSSGADESLTELAKTDEVSEKSATSKVSEPVKKNEPQPMPAYVRQKSGDTKNARPRTSLRPPSVRPASARPGAPRRRDKNIEIVLQPDEMVKMGEIKVKIENLSSELEDDGENLIIIEDQDNQLNDVTYSKQETVDESQQGHLVQQILETQKEFTSAAGESGQAERMKFDKEWDKNRQSSAKQVDQLRDALQKLTRSVNPLGKLLDFLQEDIDSMDREFEMWRDNYRQTKIELNREKGLTETAIEPMRHQLAQIELSIKENVGMINLSRANILQNEQKIYKLLTDL